MSKNPKWLPWCIAALVAVILTCYGCAIWKVLDEKGRKTDPAGRTVE